jgi:hypothetical protein
VEENTASCSPPETTIALSKNRMPEPAGRGMVTVVWAFSGLTAARLARMFINQSANAPKVANPVLRKTRRGFERDSVIGSFDLPR